MRIENLMALDLINMEDEECLDQINYIKMRIIRNREYRMALEANTEIQAINPSGKAKVATEGQSCTLNA